jgi:hypothetical protein
LSIIDVNTVIAKRISLLINLSSGVSKHCFDLPAHEAYISVAIGLPNDFWDVGDQRPILFFTCPQALL